MPNPALSLIAQQPGTTGEAPLLAGVVAPPAPTAFGDELWVLLPDLSTERPVGPCKWAALRGTTLPAVGTPVRLMFDDAGVPVVVSWDGTYGAELTGTPTAPTAAVGTDTTQIATTAFVHSAVAGEWQNLTFGEHTEAGSHTPQVREEANGLLRFTGALYIKAELVPTENEGPVLANSPIQFKGGGSGFIYATAIRYNSVGKKHESGVVIECEDGTNDIRLAGGPTLVDGDQVDFDGIALKLR